MVITPRSVAVVLPANFCWRGHSIDRATDRPRFAFGEAANRTYQHGFQNDTGNKGQVKNHGSGLRDDKERKDVVREN